MESLIVDILIFMGVIVIFAGAVLMAAGPKRSPEEQAREDEEQTVFLRNYEEERKRNKTK